MTLRYQLDIQLIEDLHTGSGVGRGDVDALVERDRNGRPVIRASHIKGLLREAAKDLPQTENLSRRTSTLFGEPGGERGALQLTSLRWLRSDSDPRGDTVVWTSTARDEWSRSPAEDTLRVVEFVPAGTTFRGELRLSDPALGETLEALLKRLDCLGSGRTRGAGLIKLSWPQPSRNTVKKQGGEPTRRMRLVIRAKEALCLPATGHPGNLIETQSFVRGQVLAGAMAAWAMAQGRTEMAEVIFGHGVSVGNAYPLPADVTVNAEQAVRSIEVVPIPLNIQTPKPGGAPADGLPWWAEPKSVDDRLGAAGEKTRTDHNDEAQEKLKRPKPHEYLLRRQREEPWRRYSPTIRVRLRNNTGIVGRGVAPTLFSVEEIAEDTLFLAELRFDTDEDARTCAEGLAPVLSGDEWLRLGRGGCPAEVEDFTWLPQEDPPAVGPDWSLTLTSDWIFRDHRLAFYTGLDAAVLAKCAGLGKDELNTANIKVDVRFVESEAVEGFNASTGLRRATAMAIRRGSVVGVSPSEQDASNGSDSRRLGDALARLQSVGERRHEGYGRFLIDFDPLASQTKATAPEKRETTAEYNWREDLLDKAKCLAELPEHAKSLPSPSQLGWMRGRASVIRDQGELDRRLLDELDEFGKRKAGENWKKLASRLRDACHEVASQSDDPNQKLSRQQFLLDAFARWAVAKTKSGSDWKDPS